MISVGRQREIMASLLAHQISHADWEESQITAERLAGFLGSDEEKLTAELAELDTDMVKKYVPIECHYGGERTSGTPRYSLTRKGIVYLHLLTDIGEHKEE